jgi:hypothetical protein
LEAHLNTVNEVHEAYLSGKAVGRCQGARGDTSALDTKVEILTASNTPRDEIRLIAESIVSCINAGQYDNAKILAQSIVAELSPIG